MSAKTQPSPLSRILLGLILLMAAGLAGLVALTFNDVPSSSQRTLNAWHEVEASYAQRATLVPGILAAVRKVTGTQAELIGRIETRHAAVLALSPNLATPREPGRFSNFMKVQDSLSVQLGLVLDLMRLYPDQSREPELRKVFDDLELAESRMAVARTDYVASARQYNANVEGVPGVWVTALFHPEARPMVRDFATAQP